MVLSTIVLRCPGEFQIYCMCSSRDGALWQNVLGPITYVYVMLKLTVAFHCGPSTLAALKRIGDVLRFHDIVSTAGSPQPRQPALVTLRLKLYLRK